MKRSVSSSFLRGMPSLEAFRLAKSSPLPVANQHHTVSIIGSKQVAAPSSTGLGGVAVEAPLRQYADSQPQTAWMPKAQAAPSAGQPTLGSSILSSLGASSVSSTAPLGASNEQLASASQGTHHPEVGSSAFSNTHSPVIFPPSAQQVLSGSLTVPGVQYIRAKL